MTNLNRWASHTGKSSYGDLKTYGLAYEWLHDCSLIEDWGGGPGYFGTLCRPGQYRNVDGTVRPNVDAQVDLENYRSQVPGILMRHVLEHNYRWQKILENALASFSERMALVLFTPIADTTTEIAYDKTTESPDLSFCLAELLEPVARNGIEHFADLNIPTTTQYGIEHMVYMKKSN